MSTASSSSARFSRLSRPAAQPAPDNMDRLSTDAPDSPTATRRRVVAHPEHSIEQRLTSHASQLQQGPQQLSPSSSSLPHTSQLLLHPSSFSFPTLNVDGSVLDLTAHQSSIHLHTPPAALSSLGAKANMQRRDGWSESENSLADSQYDMIDDLSEISNDDHETASIVSNNDQSQSAPEDASNVADAEGQDTVAAADCTHGHMNPPDAALSFVQVPSPVNDIPNTPESQRIRQIRAENDLIDSYMSDDLETPRQSAIHAADLPVPRQYTSQFSDEHTNRILFVSEQAVPRQTMDAVCRKLASCMDSSNSVEHSEHRVVRLPATPSGILASFTTMVYGPNGVSATVQHCVGAERRLRSSYQLRILDSDGQKSTFYTVGADAKLHLQRPDIVVFFTGAAKVQHKWLETACIAVQSIDVPVIVICDVLGSIPSRMKRSLPKTSIFEVHDFLIMERAELAPVIAKVSRRGATAMTTSPRPCSKRQAIIRLFLRLLIPALPLILLLLYGKTISDIHLERALRRESLVAALDGILMPSEIAESFHVDHLLPQPPAQCFKPGILGWRVFDGSCLPTAHFQGIPPDSIFVSLAPHPYQPPQLSAIHVFKNNGRDLSFNQTELIKGVYGIKIDADEAVGTVTVNLLTRKPEVNFTITHDFGPRIQEHRTPEQLDTVVRRFVGKEIAVVRKAANSLTAKFSSKMSQYAWSATNVTSRLAMYVTQDFHTLRSTTASMLSRAALTCNQTAVVLAKDVDHMQKGLARLSKDLSTVVKSQVEVAKINTKALIKWPISTRHRRLKSSKDGHDVDDLDNSPYGSEYHLQAGTREKPVSLIGKRQLSSTDAINSRFTTPVQRLKKAKKHVDALSERAWKRRSIPDESEQVVRKLHGGQTKDKQRWSSEVHEDA